MYERISYLVKVEIYHPLMVNLVEENIADSQLSSSIDRLPG